VRRWGGWKEAGIDRGLRDNINRGRGFCNRDGREEWGGADGDTDEHGQDYDNDNDNDSDNDSDSDNDYEWDL
jgi:hypothetical protein